MTPALLDLLGREYLALHGEQGGPPAAEQGSLADLQALARMRAG